MHNEFTAIIERDGDWFIAYCPEIPGANGQGRTKEECLQSLSDALNLILQDRREDALRGVPSDAVREVVTNSLWCNPLTGHIEAVPRHAEIPERLAKKICKALSASEQ